MNPSTLSFSLLILACIFFAGLAIYWAKKYFSAREEIAKLSAQNLGQDNLLEQMKGLAAQALQGNTESFLQMTKADQEKHKMAMENLLQPIKQSLEAYKKELTELETERRKSYNSVENELKKVIQTSEQLSLETSSLKDALKRPHVRGRWGEVQLKNCIELAGMSEHADVSFQDSTTDEEGAHRPDMTVRMPGGRLIVVDAKTPIDAFIASIEATEPEQKNAALIKHGTQVRAQVKKLSEKAYQDKIEGSPDFTVMFLPNESFLYAALETQKDLIDYSLDRKVLIATPPTLIGLLKVIRYGWNEERLAESAALISEVGTELHKRMCEFVDGYLKVGDQLEKAKNEYDKGLNRLQSRVIVQAEKLEKLGAKSKKDLGTHSVPEAITSRQDQSRQ